MWQRLVSAPGAVLGWGLCNSKPCLINCSVCWIMCWGPLIRILPRKQKCIQTVALNNEEWFFLSLQCCSIVSRPTEHSEHCCRFQALLLTQILCEPPEDELVLQVSSYVEHSTAPLEQDILKSSAKTNLSKFCASVGNHKVPKHLHRKTNGKLGFFSAALPPTSLAMVLSEGNRGGSKCQAKPQLSFEAVVGYYESQLQLICLHTEMNDNIHWCKQHRRLGRWVQVLNTRDGSLQSVDTGGEVETVNGWRKPVDTTKLRFVDFFCFVFFL